MAYSMGAANPAAGSPFTEQQDRPPRKKKHHKQSSGQTHGGRRVESRPQKKQVPQFRSRDEDYQPRQERRGTQPPKTKKSKKTPRTEKTGSSFRAIKADRWQRRAPASWQEAIKVEDGKLLCEPYWEPWMTFTTNDYPPADLMSIKLWPALVQLITVIYELEMQDGKKLTISDFSTIQTYWSTKGEDWKVACKLVRDLNFLICSRALSEKSPLTAEQKHFTLTFVAYRSVLLKLKTDIFSLLKDAEGRLAPSLPARGALGSTLSGTDALGVTGASCFESEEKWEYVKAQLFDGEPGSHDTVPDGIDMIPAIWQFARSFRNIFHQGQECDLTTEFNVGRDDQMHSEYFANYLRLFLNRRSILNQNQKLQLMVMMDYIIEKLEVTLLIGGKPASWRQWLNLFVPGKHNLASNKDLMKLPQPPSRRKSKTSVPIRSRRQGESLRRTIRTEGGRSRRRQQVLDNSSSEDERESRNAGDEVPIRPTSLPVRPPGRSETGRRDSFHRAIRPLDSGLSGRRPEILNDSSSEDEMDTGNGGSRVRTPYGGLPPELQGSIQTPRTPRTPLTPYGGPGVHLFRQTSIQQPPPDIMQSDNESEDDGPPLTPGAGYIPPSSRGKTGYYTEEQLRRQFTEHYEQLSYPSHSFSLIPEQTQQSPRKRSLEEDDSSSGSSEASSSGSESDSDS